MNEFDDEAYEFLSFDDWHNKYKYIFPEALNNVLEEKSTVMSFLFFWKKYEHIIKPKLLYLISQQYPLVFQVKEQFAAHIYQNITHRIFEFAEYAWKIAESNKMNLTAAEVWPQIYDLSINSDVYDPTKFSLVTIEDFPNFYKFQGEEKTRQLVEEENESRVKTAQWKITINQEVIAVLQTDLLQLLPELINMESDWWKCYKFLLEEQCYMWHSKNQRMEYLIEKGLDETWVDKRTSEVLAEIERREMDNE